MEIARRVEIETIYEGRNITGQINDYLVSVQYEDIASGSSDILTIQLRDDKKLWLTSWMPNKGDTIRCSMNFINWFSENSKDVLHCGDFRIDQLSCFGRPITVEIGAASTPQDSSFNSQERTKTYESTNIRQIAEEIAGRAGIGLYYEAATIPISSIEQDNETDSEFLFSLCQSYGLAMKIYANRIIIFDEEIYENKPESLTIDESEISRWDYTTRVAGTYTGATVSFTDPEDDENYTVTIGGGSRILNINVTADNTHDAELKGIAKLNEENKKSTTLSVTTMAIPGVVAGINIKITGLGGVDGKYYVDSVITNAAAESECTMNIKMHKVTARIKNAPVMAVESARADDEAAGTPYVIKNGDTLWAIAEAKLGRGTRYIEIYNLNKDIIESAAKAHGYASSENGTWIWGGTEIIIPPK